MDCTKRLTCQISFLQGLGSLWIIYNVQQSSQSFILHKNLNNKIRDMQASQIYLVIYFDQTQKSEATSILWDLLICCEFLLWISWYRYCSVISKSHIGSQSQLHQISGYSLQTLAHNSCKRPPCLPPITLWLE